MLLLLKKSIANSFTLLNLLFGFSAIVLIALSFSEKINHIQSACILIYIAALVDVFDGKIARKLGTSGDFGKEIDSLADLVSFCLVPAFLIFYHYYDPYNSEGMNLEFQLLIVLSSLPLLLGAIRLAKFNAYENQSKQNCYLGLPTPGNALFICSMIFCVDKIFTNKRFLLSIDELNYFEWICLPIQKILLANEYSLLALCTISSILLISKVSYSKFPIFKGKLGKENFLSLIGLSIFFVILIIGFVNKEYNNVILFFISYYIISGLFKWILNIFNGDK